MQYAVLALDEFSTASRFYRSVSQTPAQATGFITIGQQLAELKLTANNLRQLVPVPEVERSYISGIATLTTYNVWVAGPRLEPVCLGFFDVPLFGQGELYVTFDPHNVNAAGKSLFKYSWLLVTAGGEQDLGMWSEDATTAVLYGVIPNAQSCQAQTKPPWELFEQQKGGYRDIYEADDQEFDLFDEDDEPPIEE